MRRARRAVEHGPMTAADTPRIVVAGGGVAGLEACLGLRSFLGEDDLSIELLCRDDRFEYRPLAVLEPFDGAPAWSMELERFAADQDVRLVRDSLVAVEPERHEAVTAHSGPLPYDALLVCVGARAVRALPGAISFRGGRDAAAVRAALDAIANRMTAPRSRSRSPSAPSGRCRSTSWRSSRPRACASGGCGHGS